MSLREFEIKKVEKVVGEYIERKRPAPHIRRTWGQTLIIIIKLDNSNLEFGVTH